MKERWCARLADSGAAIVEILAEYIIITHAISFGLLACFVLITDLPSQAAWLFPTDRDATLAQPAVLTTIPFWTGFRVVQATLLSQISLTGREIIV